MTDWTRDAVEALGPTTTVPVATSILGVNAETGYAAIRNGTWTATRVLRIGRVIKIPTLDLVRLLFDPAAATAPAGPRTEHHGANEAKSSSSHAHTPQSQCGCRFEGSGAVVPLRSTS
jgi:hypothetical protein